jgi:hypothetical protein
MARRAAVPENQEDVITLEQPCRGHQGQASQPRTAASALTAAHRRGGSTRFRCGGCETTAEFIQGEPGYGRRVQYFLGQHEACGNAVEISAVRHPADAAGERTPAGV